MQIQWSLTNELIKSQSWQPYPTQPPKSIPTSPPPLPYSNTVNNSATWQPEPPDLSNGPGDPGPAVDLDPAQSLELNLDVETLVKRLVNILQRSPTLNSIRRTILRRIIILVRSTLTKSLAYLCPTQTTILMADSANKFTSTESNSP